MSRRGNDIDFDFFDEGPGVSQKEDRQPREAHSNANGSIKNSTALSAGKRQTKHSEDAIHRSSSRSDSGESQTRHSHSVKIAATVPRVEVDDNSDSSSNSGKMRGPTKSGKSGEPKPGSSKSEKTSGRSRSTSRSSSRSRSDSATSTDSASTTDSARTSDGSMTDVSPLQSPKDKNPNAKKSSKKRVGIDDTVYDMESRRPKTAANKSRPLSGKSTSSTGSASAFDKLMEADKDTMNLDLLMQAIMEMEEDRQENHEKIARQGVHVQNPTSLNRKNMSFSNDRVKEIDRENQRLMQNILKNATMVKKQKTQPARKSKPVAGKHTPSAVNRMRDQKRIEQENFALLGRLNAAKADPTLQRERQLDDFNRSKLFGVPMKAVHPDDGLKSRSYSSLEGHFSSHTRRSRPSSAVSARPPSAKLTLSRPSSAKSWKSDVTTSSSQRPLSGNRRPRPAWDERW